MTRRDYRVVVGLTYGRLGGVDTFAINLVRGLAGLGIPAHILLTEDAGRAIDKLTFPSDVPIQRLPCTTTRWRERWQTMVHYLEDLAPCIYIPNYDWKHSCVSPCLSDQVGIVGIVHSDDPDHYEHVERLGQYWNAIPTVSDALTRELMARHPDLADRMMTLHLGVPVPSQIPARPDGVHRPLNVLYSGRLAQYQKRALDVPVIVEAALDMGVPIQLTVLGSGRDEAQFRAACAPLAERCEIRFCGTLPNDQVLEHCAENDVFLLPSEFEGLPIALLEAMGHGCVPVVSDIRSGIPDVVEDGVNGFVAPVGDVTAFAGRLAELHADPTLRQEMALKAHETVKQRRYTTEDMAKRYAHLFEQVWDEVEAGHFRRPQGDVLPPEWMKPLWKHYLPGKVRDMAGPLYFALNGKPAPRQ